MSINSVGRELVGQLNGRIRELEIEVAHERTERLTEALRSENQMAQERQDKESLQRQLESANQRIVELTRLQADGQQRIQVLERQNNASREELQNLRTEVQALTNQVQLERAQVQNLTQQLQQSNLQLNRVVHLLQERQNGKEPLTVIAEWGKTIGNIWIKIIRFPF